MGQHSIASHNHYNYNDRVNAPTVSLGHDSIMGQGTMTGGLSTPGPFSDSAPVYDSKATFIKGKHGYDSKFKWFNDGTADSHGFVGDEVLQNLIVMPPGQGPLL